MPLILEKKFEQEQGGIPVVSLQQYLSQHRTLIIPPWQREYSWSISEDEQVDTLLKDLLDFLNDKNAKEYLIGSVVLCELEGDKKAPLLIDGQQRTLTLTLLLMCCAKFLRLNDLLQNNNPKDAALISDINNCLTANPMGTFVPRVRMQRSGADEILHQIYNWSVVADDFDKSVFKNMDKKSATQKNLINSTEFIFKKINGTTRKVGGNVEVKPGEWVQKEKIKDALLKLLNGVKFIQISVNDRRESISVFDHINNRGMSLNPADLVKNLMFENVEDAEFSEISDNWGSMSENLMGTKKARLQDPRFLLRALSHTEYGAHESYDRLDVFWSKKFEESKKSKETGIGALTFSKLLPEYSQYLQQFVTRDSKFKFPLSDIFLAGEMGSVQHYSVLLAGAHLRNPEAFATLAKQVNYRTLLYMLAEERTQLFDAMIPNWAHSVRKLPSDAKKEHVIAVYLGKDSDGNFRIKPSEALFKDLEDHMKEWDYTNTSQKKKIRVVLALLSTHLNSLCKAEVKIEDAMRTRKKQGENHPWEIEHIFPQSKNAIEGVQTIGNLTLLSPSDNNNLKDALPNAKKEHYSKCQLLLTNTIAGIEVPNSAQAGKIADLFKELKIESVKWSLDDWNIDSIHARLSFYHAYLKHIIKSVES